MRTCISATIDTGYAYKYYDWGLGRRDQAALARPPGLCINARSLLLFRHTGGCLRASDLLRWLNPGRFYCSCNISKDKTIFRTIMSITLDTSHMGTVQAGPKKQNLVSMGCPKEPFGTLGICRNHKGILRILWEQFREISISLPRQLLAFGLSWGASGRVFRNTASLATKDLPES